jgi:hypothetical protein
VAGIEYAACTRPKVSDPIVQEPLRAHKPDPIRESSRDFRERIQGKDRAVEGVAYRANAGIANGLRRRFEGQYRKRTITFSLTKARTNIWVQSGSRAQPFSTRITSPASRRTTEPSSTIAPVPQKFGEPEADYSSPRTFHQSICSNSAIFSAPFCMNQFRHADVSAGRFSSVISLSARKLQLRIIGVV